MQVTHEPWLVALSLVVAIQGAYVGLSLAVQVAEAVGLRRRLLLAGAAISLAVAIWAMHFVGMLAARLSIPVDYLVFPTLLSFLVCVIVVGAAVFAASAGPLTAIRLATSAVFMGGGIVSMHYIGMSALHASAHLTHAPIFVAGSVVVAIAAFKAATQSALRGVSQSACSTRRQRSCIRRCCFAPPVFGGLGRRRSSLPWLGDERGHVRVLLIPDTGVPGAGAESGHASPYRHT